MSVVGDILKQYPHLANKRFWQIYLRDARCMHCGIWITSFDKGTFRPVNGLVKFTIDHIIPKCRRGSNHCHNLQVLCEPCNRYKGDKLESDFMDVPSDFFSQLAEHKTIKTLDTDHPDWKPWYGL